MKQIAIIRDRGQLTIPDSVRQAAPWAAAHSAVMVVVGQDEIVLKPLKLDRGPVDWAEIWEGVRSCRAIKGVQSTQSGQSMQGVKSTGAVLSAADFLEKDRASH